MLNMYNASAFKDMEQNVPKTYLFILKVTLHFDFRPLQITFSVRLFQTRFKRTEKIYHSSEHLCLSFILAYQ